MRFQSSSEKLTWAYFCLICLLKASGKKNNLVTGVKEKMYYYYLGIVNNKFIIKHVKVWYFILGKIVFHIKNPFLNLKYFKQNY